jgi:chromosome segregation ATPase
MERDVNIKLIFIILILLLALVGTSVFYQIRYNDLKSGYERSFKDFNNTFNNLTIKQKDLYSNISEINVSANRELALAAKLEKKTLELEEINSELSSIQQNLFECQQNYDMASTNNTILNEVLAKHTASIGRLQGMIDRLRTDVENDAQKSVILDDISKLQTELYALKSY